MDINKFLQSKKIKIAILGLAGLIIILLAFALGAFVGFKKANFSYKWGENYHRNFAGPRNGFFNDFSGRDFIEPHGAFGQIIKIDLAGQPSSETPTSTAGSGEIAAVIIKGNNDTEKIVLIKNDTVIRGPKEIIKLGDLKIDDYIVVIGEPNNSGQIEAKLIRIMPPQPTKMPFGAPLPM